MKRLLYFLVVALFISAPAYLFAQSTLTVYATQGYLNEIIEADTLADGTQAHEVYRLVSLDTTYKYTGTITSISNITVEGVLDPVTGRPPCIQPAVLQDGSLPGVMFALNGAGIKGTFKNLYLLAKATKNDVFVIVMESIMAVHLDLLSRIGADLETSREVAREHGQLLEAIEAGDRERAYGLLDAHVVGVRERLNAISENKNS
jgi:hypothetical protein